MMIRKLHLAIFGLACSAVGMASDTSMFPTMHEYMPLVSSVVYAGGGPENFSTEKGLKMALGKEGYQREYDKLAGQFGENKAYKFMVINDFVWTEALRMASVQGMDISHPMQPSRYLARDILRSGMDREGMFTSERQMDNILTPEIHKGVMIAVDERFGKGASDEYHMMMNQLASDVAAEVGITNLRVASIPSNP